MSEITNQDAMNELLRIKKHLCGPQGCCCNTENKNQYKADCLSIAIRAINAQKDKGLPKNFLHPCLFSECPPGMFEFEHDLFLKSEYENESYCISNGEIFWGGANSPEERAKLIVFPISYEFLLFIWSHSIKLDETRFDNLHIYEPGNKAKDFAENCEILIKVADIPKFMEPETQPLTLEQLRQMGGEPVWVETMQEWRTVYIGCENDVRLYSNFNTISAKHVLDNDGRIYTSKPK